MRTPLSCCNSSLIACCKSAVEDGTPQFTLNMIHSSIFQSFHKLMYTRKHISLFTQLWSSSVNSTSSIHCMRSLKHVSHSASSITRATVLHRDCSRGLLYQSEKRDRSTGIDKTVCTQVTRPRVTCPIKNSRSNLCKLLSVSGKCLPREPRRRPQDR